MSYEASCEALATEFGECEDHADPGEFFVVDDGGGRGGELTIHFEAPAEAGT